MEEITFSGTAEGIMLMLAMMYVMYILFFIVLFIIETLIKIRWEFNYNILQRGKNSGNPIKLSIMYQADFFRVKAKLPDGIVKIAGIEVNLGFKECIESLYVRFPENIYSNLKPERIYDFKMRLV